MKFTKLQLVLFYLLATAMFSVGLFVLVKDMHIVGGHSVWNKVVGVGLMMMGMSAMFPIQMAAAIKMLTPLVFGWRKGEIPPPAGIAPGTPVESTKLTSEEAENARSIQIRETE